MGRSSTRRHSGHQVMNTVDIENRILELLTLSRRARGPSLRQIITHVVVHRSISDAAGCLRRMFLSFASLLLLLAGVCSGTEEDVRRMLPSCRHVRV